MKLDLISDLYIEKYEGDYFKKRKIKPGSDLLIVAGDISDSFDISIKFLNQISKYYKKIFYIEGNHEHMDKYPSLYSIDEIDKKIKENGNKKIIYLGKNNILHQNTLFIGVSGWWDYSKIGLTNNYFKNTKIKLTEKEKEEFHINVKKRAQDDAIHLCNKIGKYKDNKKIKQIIIISHTSPINVFINKKTADVRYNSYFETIKRADKLNYWLFGHTRENIIKQDINNVTYVSSPYDPKTKNFTANTIKIENFRKTIFN